MVAFLTRASVAVVGTRDASNVPSVHWLSGWSVDPDQACVTCLVPTPFDDGLLANLERTGHVAMVAEVIGPHECYQFKGRYAGTRELEATDRETHRACRDRFVDAVSRLTRERFPRTALAARFREPALAVRFRVEEIYVQTPGPGAGGRLYPPADVLGPTEV